MLSTKEKEEAKKINEISKSKHKQAHKHPTSTKTLSPHKRRNRFWGGKNEENRMKQRKHQKIDQNAFSSTKRRRNPDKIASGGKKHAINLTTLQLVGCSGWSLSSFSGVETLSHTHTTSKLTHSGSSQLAGLSLATNRKSLPGAEPNFFRTEKATTCAFLGSSHVPNPKL